MTPSSAVFALVLVAALLHAVWNALIKSGDDPWLTTLVVFVSGSLVCVLALPFVPVPPRESWPYIAVGALLHNGYVTFLVLSYRIGDLSHVYPLARGSAPLLVALLSSRVVGEALAPAQAAGTLLVCAGIASLAVDRSVARPEGRRAAAFALTTGVWIAGYTLVDGAGVRRAGSPLGYLVWLQAVEALPFAAVSILARRRDLPAFLRRNGARGALGGVLATAAYSLVLWAYSLGPIAPIAALRETSTLFAAFLGTLVLGEPFGRRRIAAAALVAAGAAALNL